MARPGAVHEAGDVSIEADVIEAVLRGFDFARIFFRDVAQGRHFRMPIKRVVVEIEFRIERQHLALWSDDERIHFHHRAIEADECSVQSVEQFRRRFQLGRFKPELLRQFAGLKRLQSGQRIDRFANDFLWRFLRHGFDFHAAFGAGDDQWRGCRAIEQNREINLHARSAPTPPPAPC